MSMIMSIGNFHCSHFALTPHSLSLSYILFSLPCANESRISTAGRALPSHSLYTHPWNSYTCLTVHASIRNRSSGRNSRGGAGAWQSLGFCSSIDFCTRSLSLPQFHLNLQAPHAPSPRRALGAYARNPTMISQGLPSNPCTL